jgi:V8-like Glu-specific endopeptidase
MTLRKIPAEFSVEDIDRELVARGAQIPEKERFKFKDKEGTPARDAAMAQVKKLYEAAPSPNPALSDLSTGDLIKLLILKTQKMSNTRGIWFGDDRTDFYEIPDEHVKKNAGCVAIICLKDNLVEERNGFSELKVKNYGKTYNLCDNEPFHDQPISKGVSFTGFLVSEDTIATAGHVVKGRRLADLRFVFGFKMEGPYAPVIRVPNEYIYKGVEVPKKVYRSLNKDDRADWALVKLDRKVVCYPSAKLSRKRIFNDQPIYVLGHPAGLPMKYAPGARIEQVNGACFGAKLDIYSGNSGSPVFSSDTHEVVGMVVRGDSMDFRNTGTCWLSVIYPNREIQSKGAECTRVSEFIGYCQKTAK